MEIYFENKSAKKVNNIYCIGRNYVEHIEELGNKMVKEPVVFLKPNASLNTTKEIRLPKTQTTIDFETELVLYIKQAAHHVKPEHALELIDGYAIGLDLTDRSKQSELKTKQLPWLLAKGFVGAAVVSCFLDYPNEAINLDDVEIAIKQNGAFKQKDSTKKMIFSIKEQLVFLCENFSLQAGDLVFTGTPSGVGPLQKNDVIELWLNQKSMGKWSVN